MCVIRALDPVADLAAVHEFYQAAPHYWLMAEGRAPDFAKAQAFFTDGPPGCDPTAAHRVGYFIEGRLSGVAELSFGFPEPEDAYLGLMMFGPWAQGQGHGVQLLAHIEGVVRDRRAANFYLAVIDANTRGAAFWRREGFVFTGDTGSDVVNGVTHSLSRMTKRL